MWNNKLKTPNPPKDRFFKNYRLFFQALLLDYKKRFLVFL
ncbi:hypothetical protein HMPREF1405_01184 [Helicobacter pylori GAM231Ai]|nr:hypothetical protein HMPREF1405_01184 [Helicobacter pylori GAM231Ai]